MISASAEFREALRQGANVVNYADITFRDGTELELTPADFMISGGCNIEDATSDGTFTVGSAIGKRITVTLANHEKQFSDYDFYKASFVVYCGIKIGNNVEKVRKGTYYVVEPETPGDIIQFSGVDAMHFFDKPYDTNLQYPATLQNILSDACIKCGVEIGFTQFDNSSFQVMVKPTDCTYREMVSWVAQIAGYNARVNNFGALELVWWKPQRIVEANVDGGNFEDYEAHDYVINGGDFTDYSQATVYDGGTFDDFASGAPLHSVKNFSIGTDDIIITGVKVTTDETEYLEGTEDYCILVTDNELALGKEQEVAEYLFAKLGTMQFRVMSVQVLCNPLYEPFDNCILKDREGVRYNSIINSVTYNTGGYTLLECRAEPPARNESYYSSTAARAVVKARRDMDEKLSSYDVAVQNMNRIAANALGYYTTNEDQPDGSRITYLHDRPTVETSQTIYKITADGFFVSVDGGETYTAGFDAQGNAIVNILSAIGIRFDWARGGTLLLGGENNTNGEIQIMNAQGVACGKINNNGISMYSPTSQVQVIITPEIGLVMRDADGNEFYGLTTRQNFTADISTSYRILRTYRVYQKPKLHAVVLDKRVYSTQVITTYQYKFRYYWVSNAQWLATDTPASAAGQSVRTLPISFKDKNISVQITDNGMTQALIDASTKNKILNHYESSTMNTKADGTTWTETAWSTTNTYIDWSIGQDVEVDYPYIGVTQSFLQGCQLWNTAHSYAGTSQVVLPMPAQNDYLTDMDALSPTNDYTYEYSYVTNAGVPSVTVNVTATELYTGQVPTTYSPFQPGSPYYDPSWIQGVQDIDLPISDLLAHTLIATC